MTATLLERDDALATLGSLAATARRGDGRVALVTGDAGQGKTTLLRHFAGGIPSGTVLLESGCDPLTTPSPLAPLHEVAGAIGLTPDDLAGPDRGALFAATLEALRECGPCVWIIDDVHWADGATIDLIRFIGRRIDRTSALMVLSFRSDELDTDHPVRLVVGDLTRSTAVERVDLQPMSIDAVRELCGASRAEHIHAVTAGNAFFVSEIAAGSDDDVPASVRDAVMARCGRLPDDVRRVVEAVSVAPRSMSFDAAVSMADADDVLLGRATVGGMLVGDTRGLRFRHELARQAVERSIPVPTRRRLHLQLLDLLVDDDVADSARLAHHAVRSGDPNQIVRHCPPAAAEAAGRLAYVEASELADSALRHRRLMPTSQLVDVLALYVDAMCGANRAADVGDAATDLLDVAERHGDPVLLSTALRAVGRQRYASGNPHDARSVADRAIDVAERGDDPDLLVGALVRRGHFAMLARQANDAAALVDRALSLDTEPDAAIEAQALNCLGCVEVVLGDDVDRGMQLLRQSLDLGERLEDDGVISLALVNLGTGAGEVRRYDDAVEWLERAIDFSEARDADFTTSYVRAWLGRVRFERGEWGLVEQAIGTAAEPAHLTSSTLTREGTRGRLAVRRGDAGAVEMLRELIDRGSPIDLQHLWPPLCGVAEAEWLAGRPAAGRDLLVEPYEQALDTDSPWAQSEIGWWLWRCGGDVRAREENATPFDQHIDGDWEGAADRWQSIGCPYEEALSRADGPTDSKLRALAIFDRLGAAPAAAWLRQRLRDEGVASVPRGPRQSTLDSPAGLTRRQSEVLELAGEGLTNAEIAARLFVSPKTVEHHMSAVLAKLGVKSRRAAVERAADWVD